MATGTSSEEFSLAMLHELIIDKVEGFLDGRTELSEQEQGEVDHWKKWLNKGLRYTKRNRARRYISDAWRVSPGLCLLIILVVRGTRLGMIKSNKYFSQFRLWWEKIQTDYGQSIMGLETIFSYQQLHQCFCRSPNGHSNQGEISCTEQALEADWTGEELGDCYEGGVVGDSVISEMDVFPSEFD